MLITDIIFGILGIGLVWAAIKFTTKKAEDKVIPELINLPFETGTSLLNDTEQKFYHELENVVGEQYTIFSKVHLSDFIDIKKGMDKYDTQRFRELLDSYSVNFLLCTPLNTRAVVALELEDIAGDPNQARERADVMDRIFKDIGFPLLRFKVRGSYAVEIKKQLEETIMFRDKTEETETTKAVAA